MEHTLTVDSNRPNSSLINSALAGTLEESKQHELSSFATAHELEENDSTELTLDPLNFDNQLQLAQAKEFLKALKIGKLDWKVFIPITDVDEDRVFVTEFLRLNEVLVGLLAIEMTPLVDSPGSRAAVVSCLLNLESIEVHLDIVQDFVSRHLSHLSRRQNWKDLQIGSISSFSTVHEFQQI